MPRNEKTEVVKSYLERLMLLSSDNTITVAKKTIARKIYEENKELFMNLDEVRDIVRYHLGAAGERARRMIADKKFMLNYKQHDLPEEEFDFDADPVLVEGGKSIGIMGDLHIPFHSNDAIDAAFNWFKEHKVDTIILNGDIIDFYMLSDFDKDPRRNVLTEIDSTLYFLDELRNEFPTTKIYYKASNHEYRLERYMRRKSYELYGVPDFDFQNILKLKFFDIEYVPFKRRIKASHCYILHGDEYRGGSSSLVNPARWLFLKSRANAICGHFHRSSEHSEMNLNDELVATWSMGCCCGLHPFYNPYNNWNHGFARLRIREDNTFDVTNMKVFNGRIL